MSVDVLVEPFYEWVVDASQIKGVRPDIRGVTYVEDPLPYIERKLLTVNTGHSAIAYLGYARGLATIHAALEDPEVREVASKALEETGLLLAREHGFVPEELHEYRQKVLARFENPRISDEVTRVARAPIRKLGHHERFVSPALRLLEMGREPTHLAAVIKAVLGFDYPRDDTRRGRTPGLGPLRRDSRGPSARGPRPGTPRFHRRVEGVTQEPVARE
jgi:mannitol-1-phosphate 5-dehydrogenase